MESNIELYQHVSLITSFLAISLGFFLIFIKSKQNKSNIYLGLLILLYSLFYLPGLFDTIGILDKFPHVIRLNFFSSLLLGPFTYLYCMSSISTAPLTFRKVMPHLAIFIFGFFYYLPVISLSGDEKLEIYNSIMTAGISPSPIWESTILGFIAVSYTFFSIRIIINSLKHLKKTNSSFNTSFHRWLLFLSCTLLIPILLALGFRLMGISELPFSIRVFSFSTLIFLIYITLGVRPVFFEKIPYLINNSASDDTIQSTKYQNSNLQDAQKTAYLDKIINYVEDQKPFLDPELTISQFSNAIDLPAHYVSQIINEQLGFNFIDFINRYRIDKVKRKLKDVTLNHFKIIHLAYDSGFNSKTAFYHAFKKHVGQTPGEYKKEKQRTQT